LQIEENAARKRAAFSLHTMNALAHQAALHRLICDGALVPITGKALSSRFRGMKGSMTLYLS
jgi:hypothetical protein